MSDSPCGAVKSVDGRREPLVCNLEADHAGDHGVRVSPGLPVYVTWRRDTGASR